MTETRLRRICYTFYCFFQRRIAPGLTNAQNEYFSVLDEHFPEGGSWLDIGCGHQVFGSWMVDHEDRLCSRAGQFVGIDLERDSLRRHRTLSDPVMASANSLPFSGESFDVVTANMVVEHFEFPEVAFREIHRVLRPGGLFVFHTPNVRNYKLQVAHALPHWFVARLVRLFENRGEDDVFETYYRVNTPNAITVAAKSVGFELQRLQTVEDTATTIILGPVVLLELLAIRLYQTDRFEALRSNIVACLVKPSHGVLSGCATRA